jgi:hypothetical protein
MEISNQQNAVINNSIQTPGQPKVKKRDWKKWIIIFILILITISFGVYLYISPYIKEQMVLRSDPTAKWNTYTNDELGYSIKLPPGWYKSTKLSGLAGSGAYDVFTSLAENYIDTQKEGLNSYERGKFFNITVLYNVHKLPIKVWYDNNSNLPKGAYGG